MPAYTDIKSVVPHTPEGEPEVWDERIPAHSPLLAHTPEAPPVEISPAFAAADFDVAGYLAEERAKDLLRFSTAGSVDDGKSTLIGRLLYDTQSVYDDQLRSIEGKGTTAPGVLDLALLTDGLRAEREQGITIDVAYRYFSTARRKFIIGDTPGHEQYTRNMATGASTADVAVVLVDARKGVLPQSRRHAYITALLGVGHIVVAVNKMDLIDYAQAPFEAICAEFTRFLRGLLVDGVERIALSFVPVSALAGDNVVHASAAMPWYTGPSLLTLLERIPAAETMAGLPFRMAVQRVLRPNLDFRGFAGQIAGGSVRVGDRITVYPSGRSSTVERIVTFDGELEQAHAPLSVTLTLADEIDISRGDLLAAGPPPGVDTALRAAIVWMDETPLDPTRRYILKHMSRTVPVEIVRLVHTVELAETPRTLAGGTLAMNGLGELELRTLQPLATDPYSVNRHTGSFVLIDPQSNATVAAGMIRADRLSPRHAATQGPVNASERATRFGHGAAHLRLACSLAVAQALERTLFAQGANVLLFAGDHAAIPTLLEAGILVLTRMSETPAGDDTAITLTLEDGTSSLHADVAAVCEHLRAAGILHTESTR